LVEEKVYYNFLYSMKAFTGNIFHLLPKFKYGHC
jgi:hypothetical protein